MENSYQQSPIENGEEEEEEEEGGDWIYLSIPYSDTCIPAAGPYIITQ